MLKALLNKKINLISIGACVALAFSCADLAAKIEFNDTPNRKVELGKSLSFTISARDVSSSSSKTNKDAAKDANTVKSEVSAITNGTSTNPSSSSAKNEKNAQIRIIARRLPEGASFEDNGNGSGTFRWSPNNFDLIGDHEVFFIARRRRANEERGSRIDAKNGTGRPRTPGSGRGPGGGRGPGFNPQFFANADFEKVIIRVSRFGTQQEFRNFKEGLNSRISKRRAQRQQRLAQREQQRQQALANTLLNNRLNAIAQAAAEEQPAPQRLGKASGSKAKIAPAIQPNPNLNSGTNAISNNPFEDREARRERIRRRREAFRERLEQSLFGEDGIDEFIGSDDPGAPIEEITDAIPEEPEITEAQDETTEVSDNPERPEEQNPEESPSDNNQSDDNRPVASNNQEPIVNAEGFHVVQVNQALAFTLSAEDPEQENISIRAIDLPEGANLSLEDMGEGKRNANIAWTPEAEGEFMFKFEISDGDKTVTEEIVATAIPGFDTTKITDEMSFELVDLELESNISVVEVNSSELSNRSLSVMIKNLDPKSKLTLIPSIPEPLTSLLSLPTELVFEPGAEEQELSFTLASDEDLLENSRNTNFRIIPLTISQEGSEAFVMVMLKINFTEAPTVTIASNDS